MSDKPKRASRKTFVGFFLVLGFLTKLVSEFLHEMGHGLFVLLFRGKVLGIYISPFWPFQFSWIKWSFSRYVGNFELSFVYLGGILLCLIVSFLVQITLLLKDFRWIYQLCLAWLGFWTFLNGVGYLILGGIKPFGDLEELIKLGCLTRTTFLILGLFLFVVGFIIQSKIFFNIFSRFFSYETSRILIVIFWIQCSIYSLTIL